nr:MAG TPA: hypothetical protein [Caudoviricetes sp.]
MFKVIRYITSAPLSKSDTALYYYKDQTISSSVILSTCVLFRVT